MSAHPSMPRPRRGSLALAAAGLLGTAALGALGLLLALVLGPAPRGRRLAHAFAAPGDGGGGAAGGGGGDDAGARGGPGAGPPHDPGASPPDTAVRQEVDVLPMRWVVPAAAGLILVIVGSVALVSCWAGGRPVRTTIPQPLFEGEPPERIAGVFQTLIAPDDPEDRPPPPPAGRVPHAFGWTDRERGLVRIPVEEAMELVVERRRSAP